MLHPCGSEAPLRQDELPTARYQGRNPRPSIDDDGDGLGGRHVVAGNQLLVNAFLCRDAESLRQHIELSGRGKSATHAD